MFEDELNGNLTQKEAIAANGESLTCYEGQLFTYYTDSNGDIICGNTRNPNYDNNMNHGCRRAACMIEREFAYKVYAELQDPVAFLQLAKAAGKYDLTPESSGYDVANPDSCQKIGGSNLRESCCGSYPNRFPYASIRSVCCNGQITPLGTC